MKRWDGKSRGSVIGYKIFLFFIKTFGVKFAYLIVRFVTYYYFIFAEKNRKAIIDFYTVGLEFTKKKSVRLARKNFFIFGKTLIDRSAFLVGKGDIFTYTFQNEQYLLDMQNGSRGGILLSAHVGNWEIAGNLLKKRVSSTINVVMLDAEMEKIKEFLQSTTGGPQFNIIPIKDDLSHIIRINNALSNNELIAIGADRFIEGAKYAEFDFLGKKAKFPLGPFIIAAKFNAPVTFVFAVKETDTHYGLSATLPLDGKMKPEEVAKLYIAELEKKVRQHPEQWFNYYNYFQ